jgi:hypothetical protein
MGLPHKGEAQKIMVLATAKFSLLTCAASHILNNGQDDQGPEPRIAGTPNIIV